MSIPRPEEPLISGSTLSVNWYRFLRDLAMADNASATDLAELTAEIATALGSPDGTLAGIPAAGLSIMQGAGISFVGTDPKFISLSLLEDSGEGDALVKITRDSFGRVEGTEAATTDDLPEGSANLYWTAARSFVPTLVADGETFTVPANCQALFALPIEIEGAGSLDVSGALVEIA